ncbi:MAG: hypothetical protein ACFE0O_14080 [Opitutales bacterium]
MLPDTSPATQAARRRHVFELIRGPAAALFGEDGRFLHERHHDPRTFFWVSMAFLEGDTPAERERGVGMVRQGLDTFSGHFWNSAASILLAKFSDRLPEDLRDALVERLRAGISADFGQRFRGYNDNYPAMAALALLVGGPLAGTDEGLWEGRACLESGAALLRRRGMLSEFVSPTYTPITLSCLAMVAEHSPDAACRDLARRIEERVWFEVAARFHPGTGYVVGPYSRAYIADLTNHVHNLYAALYAVFGDALPLHDGNTFFPDFPEDAAFHSPGPENVYGHCCWHMVPDYHIPEAAVRLAWEKPLPMTVRADAEQACFRRGAWMPRSVSRTPLMEVAAGPIQTTAYLADDYGFGFSDKTFLDGSQMAGWHLQFNWRTPRQTFRDIGTLFPRFRINSPDPHHRRHFPDQGRLVCHGHEGLSLALYSGLVSWGLADDNPEPETVETDRIRTSVVLPLFGDGHDLEVWLGDRPATLWEDALATAVPVHLRLGRIAVTLYPLARTDYGRRAVIRIERVGAFALVSLFNYEGDLRAFNDVEIAECLNGFGASIGNLDTSGDFADWRASRDGALVTDDFDASDGVRTATLSLAGASIGLRCSPVSSGIQWRTTNGRAVAEPKLDIPGVDPAVIPFYPEPV